MASEIRAEIESDGTENGKANESGRGSAESESTTNTKTSSKRGRRGTITGNTGTGRGNTGETEEVFPIVVDVEKPKAKRKPRKVSKKATNESNITSEQISILITSLSSIIATRPNTAHWQITPQESQSIAEPLSKIIEKNENLKNLGEHADALALVTACITVIVPRVILSVNLAQSEKEKNKNGRFVKQDRGNNKKSGVIEKTENNQDSRGDNRNNADNGTSDAQSEFYLGESISF